jgi:GT2 family glycosyltransferase
MLDLSIVIPTCNRAALLQRAIGSLSSTLTCRYEIIVVDGASTDGTQQIIESSQKQLGSKFRAIRETKREGFVKATNKGFRASRGRFLTWLNDDARAVGSALQDAMTQLEQAGAESGFVAMFHKWHSPKNVAYETQMNGSTYQLCHVRGTLYANFCMGLRETYHRLNYFDERYYFYAADPDLSLKAWHAGYQVIPGFGCCIDHDEHDDERRSVDSARAVSDNELLFAKWNLPAKNLEKNDFDPVRPCTLQGLRSESLAA